MVGLFDATEIFYFSSSELGLLVGWLGGWGVDRVNTLAASCRCPESEHVHIKLGEPDKVIVDVARSIDASMVIVGNSHRSGIAALMNGNTAEKILDKLDCNVLAMP